MSRIELPVPVEQGGQEVEPGRLLVVAHPRLAAVLDGDEVQLDEPRERLAHPGAAHPELLAQLPLRRHRRTRREGAVDDPAEELVEHRPTLLGDGLVVSGSAGEATTSPPSRRSPVTTATVSPARQDASTRTSGAGSGDHERSATSNVQNSRALAGPSSATTLPSDVVPRASA